MHSNKIIIYQKLNKRINSNYFLKELYFYFIKNRKIKKIEFWNILFLFYRIFFILIIYYSISLMFLELPFHSENFVTSHYLWGMLHKLSVKLH